LLSRQLDSFDPALTPRVGEQLKETGTWVTMTLTVGGRLLNLPADNYASHPLRKYIYPGIWRTWDIESGRRKPPAPDALRVARARVRMAMDAVPVFHRVGVNMLAGLEPPRRVGGIRRSGNVAARHIEARDPERGAIPERRLGTGDDREG